MAGEIPAMLNTTIMAENLPSLADLHYNIEEAFKNDKFKKLVNEPPHSTWIQKNPFADNAEYIPIDKVEYFLDVIFQDWKIEILEAKQLFNAAVITVRLHYKHPVTGLWLFHDGVGAKELQTKSQSGNLKADLSNMTKSAVQMAFPIAKSMAIRDAADHIGKLFGRDLNRKNTIQGFSGRYNTRDQAKEPVPAAAPVESQAEVPGDLPFEVAEDTAEQGNDSYTLNNLDL